MARIPIPDTVKLRLWVKSGGRCQFKGCNRPLWREGLTLSEGNFAEIAHIIAASENGPRGNDLSPILQINYDNLMFLCKDHHAEVDMNAGKYPADLLKKWKNEHEERIEIQTAIPQEIHQSTILVFKVNIGDRVIAIPEAAIFNAIFPRYPTDKKGILIEKTDFDRTESPTYWQQYAKDIQRKVNRYFEEGLDRQTIKHLSIFAIAPQPLLVFLGKCIGDTVPSDIYQAQRNIVQANHTWSWQENEEIKTSYKFTCIEEQKTDNILLIIALSDKIEQDKYQDLLQDTPAVYQITIDNPSPHFLQNRKQLEDFAKIYRYALNEIQAIQGRNCTISLLLAVPVAVAVTCGRVLLPTKDPTIGVCEYYVTEGFKQVLQIL